MKKSVRILEFGKQRVEESPSGKTWKVSIHNAFWDNTVGIRDKIVEEACRLLNRRLEISVGNPSITFTIPAWKVRLECPVLKKKFKFPEPMRLYMVPIPREKL